ncbi:Fic family protein [Vreelandella nigrificans]|uniref:Cell filamentation protein Fic n=1 Tax=Vreelandella nigrificans TaxID=2042704 RepID=A0A2A4HJK9_9GAMM|nr:Fic family protein [Halomonas nigrificans]PCF94627.1 cell filamentation protein Fic [Halomonas nigrificans]
MSDPASFHHYDLVLLNPSFDSPLVDVLTELEYLRRLRLGGSTPAPTFFQLKNIFHILESLGSARIEGNHTTLADYVESTLEGTQRSSDHLSEIANIERAMSYIEEELEPDDPISEHFIRELHQLAVDGLEREGDETPGAYRAGQVKIAKSSHLPPEPFRVGEYMHELVNFINNSDQQKYDLMKVALAHHRFGWIHPFTNGNGRVVRLLTYALMIKYGFNVSLGKTVTGRVLNPTAVFCNDRERYYEMLSLADSGSPEALHDWCVYVLQGILDELKKLDKLSDYTFLKENILWPALEHARERKLITTQEKDILNLAIERQVVKASDLASVMKGSKPPQRTYQVRKLVEAGMLRPIAEGARQYTIGFDNSFLVRGVIKALSNNGFIPPQVEGL